MEDAAKRPQQRSFAESRNALEEHVTTRQKANQNSVDNILLSYDDFRDLVPDAIQLSHGLLKAVIVLHESMVARSDNAIAVQWLEIGVPRGIRTPVTAVKGRCPRPLDDGD